VLERFRFLNHEGEIATLPGMPGAARDAGDTVRQGLLVIGGSGPTPNVLRDCAKGVQLVIAADSGLDRCIEAGIVPDLVVGDMDSLSDRAVLARFAPEKVMLFSHEQKDETDTEIGARLAFEKGCRVVTIAGGGGGRMDHLLGVAALFERDPAPTRWVTDREDLRLVAGEAVFDGWRGSTVSVFPVGARAAGMHSEGLQWPLDGLEFRRGYGGISNRAVADRVRIAVGIGKLLVIHFLP
jgi:thiamine pyrophosphokinase